MFLKIKLGSWDNKLYVFNLKYGNKIDYVEAHDDSITTLVYLRSKVKIQ